MLYVTLLKGDCYIALNVYLMAYLRQNRSFIFDNFYAEARSRETYTNKLNYEKTKQKKIRKILITNFYLLFSFSKRKINIYMVSKLCNATTALQYL